MTALYGPLGPARTDPAIKFDVAEGRALEVLSVLLGRARGAVVTAPAKFDSPRQAFVAAGARRIARSVGQYLSLEGGYRERTLLRDGRRASGRVWSPSLGVGFAPRYTAASRSLWLGAAATLPTLAGLDASSDAVRKASRVLASLVETSATASGDWVFYAIAHEAIRAFRLTATDEQTLQRRLREGSPVATLLFAESDAARDVMQGRFRRLLARDAVRVVECVEDRLARAWFRRASQVWASRLSPEELTRRWSALGVTLNAWLDAIDEARRMDLARPLITFVDGLVKGPFSVGGDAVRESLAKTSGLRNLRERDALIAAVAGVTDMGVRLLRRREELAGERYGDERYEEAQVYLRDADRSLTPSRRAIEGTARSLSGVIG